MASPVDLQSTCQSSFIRALGDIATEKFTCGGAVGTPPKVLVSYLNKAGVWCGAQFPGLNELDYQQLLMIEAFTVASFGRGKETVVDKSYRDA